MEPYGALEKAEALKTRTKQFSLRVLKLFRALPRSEEARVIGRQLLRSATSVGANYRAVLPRPVQKRVHREDRRRGRRD